MLDSTTNNRVISYTEDGRIVILQDGKTLSVKQLKTEYLQRMNEYQAAAYLKNPARRKASTAKRRSLKRSGGVAYTSADVDLQYRSQRGKCWHCGKSINDGYHIDHLIPLNRGGSNKANNIVISCPHCNLSRQDKLPHEWNGRLI